MIDDKRIRKNIICLRKLYGESQKDLAKAVDVRTQAVTQWETGSRNVTTQNLVRIAEHYHISIDDLINGEYTEDISSTEVSERNLNDLCKRMFFMIQTKQAASNLHFKHGCEIAIKAMWGNSTVEETHDLIILAINEFKSSLEEGIKYAPNANIITLILLDTLINMADYDLGTLYSLLIQPASKKRQKALLQVQESLYSSIKRGQPFISKLNDKISPHLIELKKSVQFSLLADYYIALLYYLGLKDNGMTYDINMQIGIELMLLLPQLNLAEIKQHNSYRVR